MCFHHFCWGSGTWFGGLAMPNPTEEQETLLYETSKIMEVILKEQLKCHKRDQLKSTSLCRWCEKDYPLRSLMTKSSIGCPYGVWCHRLSTCHNLGIRLNTAAYEVVQDKNYHQKIRTWSMSLLDLDSISNTPSALSHLIAVPPSGKLAVTVNGVNHHLMNYINSSPAVPVILDRETLVLPASSPAADITNAGTVDALLPATIHNQTNRKPIPE